MKNLKYIVTTGFMAMMMCCCLYFCTAIGVKTIAGEEVTVEAEITGEEETTGEFEETTSDKEVTTTKDEEVTTTSKEEITTTKKEEVTTPSAVEKPVNGYIVRQETDGVRVYYNGKLQKKIYLAIRKSGNSYTVISPKTKNANIYYFDKNGIGKKYIKKKIIKIQFQNKVSEYFVKKGKIGSGWYKKKNAKFYYSSGKMVTGWKKIKKNYYYFNEEKNQKGELLTNTIIDGKKSYYVDETGARVTSKDIMLAVKYVEQHTEKSWSQSKKLSACYSYLWRNFSYQRFYGIPNGSNMPGYATYMLTNRRGNCFVYASTFAYIAKVLGYESRVAVGSVTSLSGGMTPHGWTEVKVNGYWYICDADLQHESHGVDSYMKTESTYKYRHTCSNRYTINIKNGKVNWK